MPLIFSVRRPADAAIRRRMQQLADAPYSYGHVGDTRDGARRPRGFNHDRYHGEIGHRAADFDVARTALTEWRHFEIPWIHTVSQGPPAEGVPFAVLMKVAGMWWTNISRVIYVEEGPNLFAFAYGTLPFHAESGEERFEVRHDPDAGAVTYTIRAFSRPRHPLVFAGYPLARIYQRRFGAESLAAMRRAVRETEPESPSDG